MEQYKKKKLEKEEILMVLKRQWMQKIHIFEDEILEDESFEKTKTQQAKNVLKCLKCFFFCAKI
jgi:hypothetical protein